MNKKEVIIDIDNPQNDLVNREAVLEAIRRISLGQTDVVKVSMMTEDYVKKLPSVNPQPCDDAISREATLKPYKDLNDEDTISVWLIRKNIEQQPPVTQKCEKCAMNGSDSKYCDNCGVKMKGER